MVKIWLMNRLGLPRSLSGNRNASCRKINRSDGFRGNSMAIFRIAAAAGLLLVLAPEQSRQAIGSIFATTEQARAAVPTREQAVEAAMAYCRKNAEACMDMGRKAAEIRGKPN
jgi:hypothetical protein